MQLGRGMIEGVARQLFAEFAARVRAQLEAAAPQASEAAAAPPREAELRVVPLLLRAAWQRIAELFRALLGRTGA